jgi:short subunit dehydrogenase-like uncharacterized protein
MPSPILVYGATGYTAGLIVEELLTRRIEPILSARSPTKLDQVVRRFGLEPRPATLDDPESIRRALSGVELVINAAGPFSKTSEPMIAVCLERGVHYIDISGEVDSLAAAALHHQQARSRGVTILCGTGFDVVPSDCLCAHVVRRAPKAKTLRIGISGLELLSPGSIKTLAAELGRPTRVRRASMLSDIAPGTLERSFDFGVGPRACVAVSWGDLVSAHYSTGVGNLETYFEATPSVLGVVHANRSWGWLYRMPGVRAAVERQAALWVPEPTPAERSARGACIVVEAEDASGRLTASRLRTPEAYTLTARTSATIAERMLAGDVEPGFQTPSRLFGPDFILGFDGVSRLDLESRD